MQGYESKRRKAIEEEMGERAKEDRALNSRLVANEDFRMLLDRLADRYNYLGVHLGDEYQRAANDAMRAFIRDFVLNSDGGPAWLAEYAEKRVQRV